MFAIDNYNFKGKKAIIRVDFNVPLNEKFEITDDTRIRATIPTIKKILNDGGAVVLMSHLGRPKGVTDKYSLKHIIKHIATLIGIPIQFATDCVNEDAQNKKKALKMGEVLLLENLRFYEEEEGKPRLPETASEEEKKSAKTKIKESQKEFVKKLAANVDVWVNDAFGTAHRAHASTALIADYFPKDKMFGYVIENELKAIDAFLLNPQHPTTAILGGSKVSSKITIIENLLNRVDNLIIGGGMTYTFSKALGGKIGSSLCEEDMLDVAKDILSKAKAKGVEICFQTDSVCGDSFSEEANTKVFSVDKIENGWMGLDAGPTSIKKFIDVLDNSKQVLWNGPVGVFEMDKFGVGTKAIAEKLVEITKKNGAFTIIGGGDSVAAINKYGLADQVSYVSTGGGALLEYIEGKELPGIKVIRGK